MSQCFTEASVDREDPYKFMCVVKGPASAKQKKIFYVYGKGWNAMKHENGVRVKPTETIAMKPDPTWPQRQHPNDVYYNVTPIEHGNYFFHCYKTNDFRGILEIYSVICLSVCM